MTFIFPPAPCRVPNRLSGCSEGVPFVIVRNGVEATPSGSSVIVAGLGSGEQVHHYAQLQQTTKTMGTGESATVIHKPVHWLCSFG